MPVYNESDLRDDITILRGHLDADIEEVQYMIKEVENMEKYAIKKCLAFLRVVEGQLKDAQKYLREAEDMTR
jgi:hypothetical protein